MSLNMDWEKWSGFQGDGIYVIFNSSSLNCLDLEDTGDAIELKRHTPNNPAQLWRITKWPEGDVYAIENVLHQVFIWSEGRGKVVKGNSTSAEVFVGEPWVRLPSGWSDETLWAIDKSMCALDPGNMVVFRSITTFGHVLAEGKAPSPEYLFLLPEQLGGEHGQEQRWLLQKQPE